MRLKQGWNHSPNGNKRLWDDTCGVGFSHIQLINISISGNTQLLELGKKEPYFRYNFDDSCPT